MQTDSLRWFSALFTLAAVLSLPAFADSAPPGRNPYIYGMHDQPDLSLFTGSNSCAKGWVTKLRYIGDDGSCPTIDETGLANKGFGVIMRLDHSGGPAPPPDPADFTGYAKTFADCVRSSKGVSVWIVANEPNIPWNHPDNRSFKPSEYGEIYHRVMQEVGKLPNSQNHQILFAAMAPWASVQPWGDWDDGLRKSLKYVQGKGTKIDAVAIHAYTKANYSPQAITSNKKWPNKPSWHHHFRQYRDYTGILKNLGITNVPLYITEAGNACDPACDPYPDKNNGYWTAMYREIDNWNQNHPAQRIRAITPYRWTQNGDGTGRDFCIGCSAPLKQDIANAVSKNWTWKKGAGCHPGACQADCSGKECGPNGCGGSCGSCGANEMCDSSGQCVATSSPDTGTNPTDTGASSSDTSGFPTADTYTSESSDGEGADTRIRSDESGDAASASDGGSGPSQVRTSSCACSARGTESSGATWWIALLFAGLYLRRRR